MSKLRKFTLTHDKAKDDWALIEDGASKAKRRFARKEDATAGAALSGALGKEGGSVKIRKRDGTYQEERTFPRGKDPKRSPG